jgi:predicted dehydrogenase
MSEISRRSFARIAGAVTAASYARILGANERIGVGYIGLGNRGDQVHDGFLEQGENTTVAVCDLRDDYMDFAIRKSRAQPRKYTDYRKLLEDKSVDAVAISTPDHWHAIMFIEACNAGKDVYVEKPLSLTVAEGRKMVETAGRTKRVVQVGLQRRSSPILKEAVQLVRGGEIGAVSIAKSYHLRNDWPHGIGNPANTAPPSKDQWEQWLGPAPYVPYNDNRSYYNFRWFYDYSGGQLTNFGVHYVDLMRWCLEKGSPEAVTAMGGKFVVTDNREIPDTMEVLWQYAGPVMLSFSQYNANGAAANPNRAEVELRGTKGTMYLDNARWEIVPEVLNEIPTKARTPLDRAGERVPDDKRRRVIEPRATKGSIDTAFHARNFLDCVKSRAKTNCDTLEGHLSNVGPLIGNIAMRTKSYLLWEAKSERFTNNQEANRYLSYEYRKPYRLP